MASLLLVSGAVAESGTVRTRIDLGGPAWQLRQSGLKLLKQAEVPGTVHLDLLRLGEIKDPFFRTNERTQQWIDKQDWEYQRTFTITKELLERDRLELVFYGLDTYAKVFVNQTLVLEADNMFRTWRVACKQLLHPGENTLRVVFTSPVRENFGKWDALAYHLPSWSNNDQFFCFLNMHSRKAGYHWGWDWGPRLVTSGIWRPVVLEAWDDARIENLQIVQRELTDSTAALTAVFEIAATATHEARLEVSDATTSEVLSSATVSVLPGTHLVSVGFTLDHPRRWWPNGLGEQHLYSLQGTLTIGDQLRDTETTRIGLREIRVVREPDEHGHSFYFEVNGVPVFAKGANYIPMDSFTPRVSRHQYEELLDAAAAANMNMLRVWGGGIYEEDVFYDIADEKGLLIWQDFMFSCAMYNASERFLDNVREEVVQNVKRLRNHPSIALWCGNNEMGSGWFHWGWRDHYSEVDAAKIWKDYKTVFLTMIPDILAEEDPQRQYWSSSPIAEQDKPATLSSGDYHFWGVWHGKVPFSEWDANVGRFMSEYGFQALPTLQTIARFTAPEDRDFFSDVVLHHQRCNGGTGREPMYASSIILDYLERDYQMPSTFEDMVYVSQLLQAHGVTAAIESHRRAMPRCMGSLYWQLNDCWPSLSWSSIDYYGHWKALHYLVRRAFAPLLLSPVEEQGSINVYLVSDKRQVVAGSLNAELSTLAGESLQQHTAEVAAPAGCSTRVMSLSKESLLHGKSPRELMLVLRLEGEHGVLAERAFFFVPPKQLLLPEPGLVYDIARNEEGYRIAVSTERLAKDVWIKIDDANGHLGDNYFDLLPGTARVVTYATDAEIPNLASKTSVLTLHDVQHEQQAPGR